MNDAPDTRREVDDSAAETDEVEVLEIEDDLDTGMHRVNVCKL